MIRHLVFFKLNESSDQRTHEEFLRRATALTTEIPEASDGRVLADAGLRTDGADYVLEILFSGPEEFGRYMGHPAHRSFVDECVLPWTAARMGFQAEL
jgi:hypothetical protein